MNEERDDDLRQAFAALRSDDAAQVPPFGRVTRAGLAMRPRFRWLRLVLLPVAVVLAVAVLRRQGGTPLPDAAVVRMAGAWRGPTDFLSETVGTAMVQPVSSLPELRLVPPGPPSRTEHDS